MNWSEKFNANIFVDDPTLVPYTSRTREHPSTKRRRSKAESTALSMNIEKDVGDAEVIDSSSGSSCTSLEENPQIDFVGNAATRGKEIEGIRLTRLMRAGGVSGSQLVGQDRGKCRGKEVKRQLDSCGVHLISENYPKEVSSSHLISSTLLNSSSSSSDFLVCSEGGTDIDIDEDGREDNVNQEEGKIDGKMKDVMEVKTLKGREYGNSAGILIS